MLHDGSLLGTWWTEGRTTLGIRHLGPLPKAAKAAVADEGARLLCFLDVEAATDPDVRFEAIT